MNIFNTSSFRICVIGLGYVGLPLAVALSKKYPVTGIDSNSYKIEEFRLGIDKNNIYEGSLECIKNIRYESTLFKYDSFDIYIVAVPTPLDKNKNPDLTNLEEACKSVGLHMSEKSIIIFESTVFPNTTEEFCIPILSKYSGINPSKINVAYSPERISPGDKYNNLKNTSKLISATNNKILNILEEVYKNAVTEKTVRCSSIGVAEAAKILENVQRDVNIALINEVSVLFKKMNLDTTEVIEAAATKWNFLPVHPGLVGGHCIGVDPYYFLEGGRNNFIDLPLIEKAREINENVPNEIISSVVAHSLCLGRDTLKIGIWGLTYKKDIKDVRNSKAKDIYVKLRDIFPKSDLILFEPYLREVSSNENLVFNTKYDILLILVNHSDFYNIDETTLINITKGDGTLLFDVYGIFSNYYNLLESIKYQKL